MSSSSRASSSKKKFFDMDNKELKAGDLVEVFRQDKPVPYKHWAVYVGGGYVVHFVTSGDPSGSGVVLKEKLKRVVGEDRWRVNNLLDQKHQPRPANAIVKEACGLVDTELDYGLLTYNCEHFATEMRYGKPESQQVRNAAAAGGGVLGLGFLGSAMSSAQ